jgi:hypothetical protein
MMNDSIHVEFVTGHLRSNLPAECPRICNANYLQWGGPVLLIVIAKSQQPASDEAADYFAKKALAIGGPMARVLLSPDYLLWYRSYRVKTLGPNKPKRRCVSA